MSEAKNKDHKILVTGANGQLGRCLRDVSAEYPRFDYHFKTSTDLDITDIHQVNELFNSENFDYCINCAAYTAVDNAESDKEKAFLVNAEAVKYLSEACKIQNTVLIHISTDFVFDGAKITPYKEEDLPNPINVYGGSKLKGEQYIQEILDKYFIIRTSWVYSKYGNNFVKTMLRLGKERDEISVVRDQIGSPTYAEDLAELILRIIVSGSEKYGIYHFSNEGEISWYDFAVEIFKKTGINIKVKPISTSAYPTTANRPKQSILDKNKIRTHLKVEILYWKNRLSKIIS